MAVSGAIIDYTGGAGERNFTVFIQLTFSGSFTTGGDPLNLTTLTNPNGLDVEGVFELPLVAGAGGLSGRYRRILCAAEVTGSTLNAFLINVYPPGGAIVSGAYNAAVTGGNVILTMQKRRV